MTQKDEQSRPTPGPWTIRRGGGHKGPSIVGAEAVHSSGDKRNELGISSASYTEEVCVLTGDLKNPSPMANARLIAAACNAVQQAAERIGMNPVDLARWLETDPGAIVNGYHETPTEIDQ